MLLNLQIKSFALIEKVELQFTKGFNVLTGETGAGKSIIIDAVNLVLGGRGSNEYIRSGAEKASVSALFEITTLKELQNYLAQIDIEVEEDMGLHLSRELTIAGKNVCRINGNIVSLSIYKEVGKYLIDVHGQHDHHSLLAADTHLSLLDGLGTQEIEQQISAIGQVYNHLKEQISLLKQLTGGEKDRARQRDIFQFQLAEINNANLSADEDINLVAAKKILLNTEKLANSSNEAYLSLYSDANSMSAFDQLNKAVNNLKEIAGIDSSISNLLEIIESSLYQIEEASRDLFSYKENIEHNPSRLAEIENRLDLINNLKKKYGESIDEILKFREGIAAELLEIDNGDKKISNIQISIAEYQTQYQKIAQTLTVKRKQLAQNLEKKISAELNELLMPHVKFKVSFNATLEPTPRGADLVEFLISPNPGEPLKPLVKIASGGELSRIMLALKVILAKLDEIPTLIFDEIDSGLGGRAVHAVGEKLALLGQERQVICVTHSPQVASFGENHIYITKESSLQRTITTIQTLNQTERIQEIARMLGGKDVTELTRQHAKELLELSGKND